MAKQDRRARQHTIKKKEQDSKGKQVTFCELFTLIVIQYGIVQADYFLDRMQPYELRLICDGLHLRSKDGWEQARLCAYVTAQANSKKKLRPTDIVKFGWEKDQDTPTAEKDIREYTLKDIEEIKTAALAREKKLKEQGII